MKILEKAKVEAAKNDVQAEIIYTQGEPARQPGHQRPERNDAW
jgi:hypothetical protein